MDKRLRFWFWVEFWTQVLLGAIGGTLTVYIVLTLVKWLIER